MIKLIDENKKISDKDLQIIKIINTVYKDNGEIESEKSIADIENKINKSGLRVSDKYLKSMLDKSREMIDFGIDESLNRSIKESFDVNTMPRIKLIDAIDYAYGLFGPFVYEVMSNDEFDELLIKNNANMDDSDPDEGFYNTMSKEDLVNVYTIIQDKILNKLNEYSRYDIAKDDELLRRFKIKQNWVKESLHNVVKEDVDNSDDYDDLIEKGYSVTKDYYGKCKITKSLWSREKSIEISPEEADRLIKEHGLKYDSYYSSFALSWYGKPRNESLTEDVEETLPGPDENNIAIADLINDAVKDEYDTISLYNNIAFTARQQGREDIAKLIDNINTEENNHVGMLQSALKTLSKNAEAIESGDEEAKDYLNTGIKENLGQDIDKFQKWVDYDMKKYGKISDTTNDMITQAGLKIVKDKYGDYEVIA